MLDIFGDVAIGLHFLEETVVPGWAWKLQPRTMWAPQPPPVVQEARSWEKTVVLGCPLVIQGTTRSEAEARGS